VIAVESSGLTHFDLPIRLSGAVRLSSTGYGPLTEVRPTLTSPEVARRFLARAGDAVEHFSMSTRIGDLALRPGDDVALAALDGGAPLIIRRGDEVIVNFDLASAQAFRFEDSKRPIYTYVPGFNVQIVPEGVRRPISNALQALSARKSVSQDELATVQRYRRLPLTSFELGVLLLHTILCSGEADGRGVFNWPFGMRAAFIALHDVDSVGLFKRRQNDPLFRTDVRHGIQGTWFIPTANLRRAGDSVDFLLEAGQEIGWHGHKHDHRDHVRPYADRAVTALCSSRLATTGQPVGMRLPKLLKSNALFELLEQRCPALRFDTSFLHGIVPYPLWVNGRQSSILEIPTTVPTDIRIHNELLGLNVARRCSAILKAQIARTEQLLEVGGLISIVTHPEKWLSERPELLEVYDQYLSYLRSRHDVWFTTAGKLFSYWSGAQTGAFDAESQATAADGNRARSRDAMSSPAASTPSFRHLLSADPRMIL
jgi:peptidoglycan/xylan/chitin deacetylase (PgdA/CDA1 family)